MIGTGTVINTGAIIAGGILGVLLKNAFPEKIQNTLIKATSMRVVYRNRRRAAGNALL
jgi:uncharacterized membrane protein YqgA involved in biofilm formation